MFNSWSTLGCCPLPHSPPPRHARRSRRRLYNSSIISDPPILFESPRLPPLSLPPPVLEPLPPVLRRIPSLSHIPYIPSPEPLPLPEPVLYPLRPRRPRIPLRDPSPPVIIQHPPPPPPVIVPVEPIPEPELQLVPYISPPCPRKKELIHITPCPLNPCLKRHCRYHHPDISPCLLNPCHKKHCPFHHPKLNLRPPIMPLGNPGYHSNADTTIVDLVAAVLISGDPYGQSDMRRLNGHNSPLGDRYMDDAVRLDDIRRINLIAQIANNAVTPRMQYAEVHPKLSTIDGRYPREFDTPHRIESFLAADNQTLDRILAAYNLPLNPSLSNSNANGLGTSLLAPRSLNSDRVRDAKLITLLQYLGVDVEGSGSGNGRLGGGSGLGGGGLGGGTQGLLAQLGRALGNGGGGNGGRGLGGLGSGSGGGGLGNTG